MKHYQYLIVGGGLAGDAAVRGIRKTDRDGSIGIFSMEPDPPYIRPDLSKGLWKGKPLEKIWRNTGDLGVEINLGANITRLDPAAKHIFDEPGQAYTYDRLLLATGGKPVHLPFGGDDILYYRSFQDYQRLRRLVESKNDFLVIGGGFIGSELAAALRLNGKNVAMVIQRDAIGGHIFPKQLSQYVTEYYRQRGVKIITNDTLTGIIQQGDRVTAHTENGATLEVDGIVAGIGIRPNVALAQQAGLQVENGIVVDAQLRASHPDIFAAGDAANFHHSLLGQRMRVEHEDNAVKMGELAGKNMACAHEAYTYAPMFYSDLFDLGYEAVGELDNELETVSDWQDPYKKGVVYYLKDRRVRGVLLWNVWDQVPAARALIAEPGPFDANSLKGRIE